MAGSPAQSTNVQRRDRDVSISSTTRRRSPDPEGESRRKFSASHHKHGRHISRERRRDLEHSQAASTHRDSGAAVKAPRNRQDLFEDRREGHRGRSSLDHSSTNRVSVREKGRESSRSRRKERSSERTSHRHHRHHSPSHRQSRTSVSHKRRHSRSASPAADQKRRRSFSPVTLASSIEPPHPKPEKQSQARLQGQWDLFDDSNPRSADLRTHPRYRSRSRDSRYQRKDPVGELPLSPVEYRRRTEEGAEHRSRHRDSAQGQARRSRSPPSRAHRSEQVTDKQRDSDPSSKRHAHVEDLSTSTRETTSRSHRIPNSPGGHQSQRRRRSHSRDSLRSRKHDPVQEVEMYNRPPYDPRYGGYPPSHHSYAHHSYPPSSYGSHAGSPAHGYPPQHSPYPYQQSQPGVPYYQPQPGKQYGGTPNHPAYPARPPPRGGGATSRSGRGHFANLSWTPGDGTTGGNLVGDESKERQEVGSGARSQHTPAAADPEDDDNPFRPPADLRADDESARKRQKTSTADKTATTPTPAATSTKPGERKVSEAESNKNKISFSIKGRASAAAAEKAQPTTAQKQPTPEITKKQPVIVSPLVQNNVPKSRNYEGNTRKASPAVAVVKTEKVKKKRLKPRPELSEEFAASESVYYRKTGNDSVVGSGTYGKVYKAVHVYTSAPVALKKIRMEGERDGVSLAVHWVPYHRLTNLVSRYRHPRDQAPPITQSYQHSRTSRSDGRTQ